MTTPKDMGLALITNKPLLLLVIADLAKWIVKFLVASSAVYYFTYVMGTGLQANYVLLANLAARLLPVTWPSGCPTVVRFCSLTSPWRY